MRSVKPTTVILDCRIKINGGTLSSPEINKIWGATHHAFAKAAHECGVGYAWLGEVGCVEPSRMEKRIERLNLHVEMPEGKTAICGDRYDGTWICNREAGHAGDHAATVGPCWKSALLGSGAAPLRENKDGQV